MTAPPRFRPILAVMAKEPVPGRVKTRLCPPLAPEDAARLYEAMLRDTLERAALLDGIDLAVAHDPPKAANFFRGVAPSGVIHLAQGAGHLGERLRRVTAALLDRGAPAVCVIGSDSPDLPETSIRRGFAALEQGSDVVLGPAADGGFYLVGVRRPLALYDDVRWSGEHALEDTLANVRRAGAAWTLLDPWADLDTGEDLCKALRRWREAEVSPPPPRTFRLLERLLGGATTP